MYRRAILGLGYLPQETSIFRGLSVEKNILAVLELAEPDHAARAERLEQLLDEFGLTRLRTSPAMGLSGGERRRIGLARALLKNAPLWLLDEPAADLDAASEADLIARLPGLFEGRTVILSSHSPRLCALADRIVEVG
ncbi:MAG TPA: ATP-binding cassette domain-containing protein, partial [Asticcacaulis sp.]